MCTPSERSRRDWTSSTRGRRRRATRSQALGTHARHDARSTLLDVPPSFDKSEFTSSRRCDSAHPLRRYARTFQRTCDRRHVSTRTVDELHLSSLYSSRYQRSHLDLWLAIPTTSLSFETRSIGRCYRGGRRWKAGCTSKLGGNGVGILLFCGEEGVGRRCFLAGYDGVGSRCCGAWMD